MAKTTAEQAMGEVPTAFYELVRAQMAWGREFVRAWTGVDTGDLQDPLKVWQEMAPTPVCHVPEPCWMPRQLGECRSLVRACGEACIRVVVTNCDRTTRTMRIRLEGDTGAESSAGTVTLGPMERTTVTVCRKVGEDTEEGTVFENLVWVEGCRDHVLRWTVAVGMPGLDSCHEIRIDDCPDYRHHWYDHFYCARGCGETGRNPNG